MKDVIIKPDAPNTLLLDKHADYIAAYGSKKDDYVSKDNHMSFSTLDTFAHFYFCLSYGRHFMLQYPMTFKMIEKCACCLWQLLWEVFSVSI